MSAGAGVAGPPGAGAGNGAGTGRGSGRPPRDDVEHQLLAWLAARPGEAFFLSEVEVGLRREGSPTADLAAAVERLEADGRIAVARCAWNDPPLPRSFVPVNAGSRGDPGAAARLEAAWGRWLRELLVSHPCI